MHRTNMHELDARMNFLIYGMLDVIMMSCGRKDYPKHFEATKLKVFGMLMRRDVFGKGKHSLIRIRANKDGVQGWQEKRISGDCVHYLSMAWANLYTHLLKFTNVPVVSRLEGSTLC